MSLMTNEEFRQRYFLGYVSQGEVLAVIDGVMNNREIGSIRNAILAIRNGVQKIHKELLVPPFDREYYAMLKIRSKNAFLPDMDNYGTMLEDAKYVVIDMTAKVDTGLYGEVRYLTEEVLE